MYSMHSFRLSLAGDAESGSLDPDAATEIALLRASRRAMATHFEVMIPAGMPKAAPAAQSVLDLVDDLEDQLSVFREHSEVSRLNERAPFEDVIVEQRLFDLLFLSAKLTRETRGAFDIATGALIKAWGFYKRAGRVPSVAERIEAMNQTGMRHVILDRERHTVRYRRQGLEINLGGIGKGYALDCAAELLRNNWQISSALLHGGTSSVLALGCPPGQAGWIVSLRHPNDSGHTIGNVQLCNRALGTSAATYQHFEYNGRKLGHLLDPRKGWPAEGFLQVSVLAPSAAEADALSTAFFVIGLEETRRYCQLHPEIGAVVMTLDGVVATINLGIDEFSAA
jgi:thiamine biosynthesis lipoprotein